jgi:hypothetical protein
MCMYAYWCAWWSCISRICTCMHTDVSLVHEQQTFLRQKSRKPCMYGDVHVCIHSMLKRRKQLKKGVRTIITLTCNRHAWMRGHVRLHVCARVCMSEWASSEPINVQLFAFVLAGPERQPSRFFVQISRLGNTSYEIQTSLKGNQLISVSFPANSNADGFIIKFYVYICIYIYIYIHICIYIYHDGWLCWLCVRAKNE